MKTKINLSLDDDIALRLKSLAKASHSIVSQWVTDKVVEEENEEHIYGLIDIPPYKAVLRENLGDKDEKNEVLKRRH